MRALCRVDRPISHDSTQQREATVCGLRGVGFKTRSCRSALGLSADHNAAAELDGFLAGVTDPAATSTVSAAGLLSPPSAAEGRYARRRGSVLDDVPDAASLKNLAANSRRKADKPRKRKRASSELDRTTSSNSDKTTRAAAGHDDDAQLLNVDASQDLQVDDCSTNAATGGIEPVDSSTAGAPTTGMGVGSPLPEDLSTVRAVDVTSQSPPEPLGGSPRAAPTTHDGDAVCINQQAWGLLADQGTSSTGAAAAGVIADYSASAGTAGGVHPASSVHDLEAAMSKHLPSATGSAELVADPYTGAGLRPHRSAAIQWISTGSGQDAATSTLLRSMYPNQRESVIRSNVYSAGAGGAVVTPSAQRQYYPASTADVQSSLLTPPGATESAFIGAGAHSTAKTPPSAAALNHVASYGLSGYGGDAYAMTPPSSVSPQDALAGAVSQYALEHPDGFYPTASQHHGQHSQHLHHHHSYHHSQLSAAIKPLHYAGAAAAGMYEHSMSYHQAAAAAAMAAGYYSSNGGSGLASYGAHYRDAMKHANVSW